MMNKSIQPEILIMDSAKGYWIAKTNSFKDNDYLGMLAWVFDEGSYWTNSVKQVLLDNGADITDYEFNGNKANVRVDKDIVIISPQFSENPEYYAIKIDRHVLLNLINEWQELVAKGAQEITFIRYDDGTITITGNC